MKKLSYLAVALLVIWTLSVMFREGEKQVATIGNGKNQISLKDSNIKTKSTRTKLGGSGRESKIRRELSYLNDVQEVSWYEVDDNNVYIGFSPVPTDWNVIIRGAAYKANKAIDFGVHVWALKGSQRGWRPGNGSFLGEVTARHGKVQD